MTCKEAYEKILEAEPDALVAGTDTPLGRHLAACERCGRAAARVRSTTAALGGWLSEATARIDPAAVVDEALAPGLPAGRTPVRRTLRWAIPLAAAATLALMFLREFSGPGALPGEPFHPRETPPGLALDVPAGRSAAVLDTHNPAITIVWFYGGD